MGDSSSNFNRAMRLVVVGLGWSNGLALATKCKLNVNRNAKKKNLMKVEAISERDREVMGYIFDERCGEDCELLRFI